jgi:DNA-directed RNA polymerase II subunit RPB1
MFREGPKRIKETNFGILSPDEIRRMSVVQVTTQELYEGTKPKKGGLFDIQMGVVEPRLICPTDERDHLTSPGYFGHIELVLPVLHFQYIKWIEKMLRCFCPICSHPRFPLDEESIKKIYKAKYSERLARAIEFSKTTKECNKCGNRLPRIVKKDKQLIHCIQFLYKNIKDKDSGDTIIKLPPEEIERIFKGITDEHCRHIGLTPERCRPEWLICSVVAVPPPSMRPPARKGGNLPMHDDLTYKLADIIKANRSLATYLEKNKNKENNAVSIECYRRVLQYHCAVLIDNANQGLPLAQQRSGRPLKCIKTRIKSKEGRVRGNLNGKRVNFSARSVITPDPNLEMDQLGVPLSIAKVMTFPQKVNQYNFEKLQKLVENGAHCYPGCNKLEIVSKSGKSRIYAMYIPAADKKKEEYARNLKIGDIVHRHLMDGDVVLFNRQPSLHRMSMMAHRVKVLPYETFRLNVNVTGPYNADFD